MQQLRPTDFREMWAHALTRTLVLQQEINNRLEQADAQTVDLLGQIPALVEEIHGLFDETKQMQISVHREMQESVTSSIQVLKLLEDRLIDRYNEIERETKLLYMRRAEVASKEKRIAEFENLGVIGKLFWKGTGS